MVVAASVHLVRAGPTDTADQFTMCAVVKELRYTTQCLCSGPFIRYCITFNILLLHAFSCHRQWSYLGSISLMAVHKVCCAGKIINKLINSKIKMNELIK